MEELIRLAELYKSVGDIMNHAQFTDEAKHDAVFPLISKQTSHLFKVIYSVDDTEMDSIRKYYEAFGNYLYK